MNLIVLAAGYATRLYPLTRDRPKPLLEIGDRPLLSHTLGRVLALGEIDEIVVVCNARFAADFETWRDGLDLAVPLHLVNDGSTEPENRLGANVDLALGLREANTGRDSLVVAGDNLIGFDLAEPRDRFRESGCPTLIVRQVENETGPSRYNDVELDADGRVTSFREKPARRRSPLAAVAVYFYPPEVSVWLTRYLEGGGNPDSPGHFVAWLVEQTPVVGAPLRGSWFDIGNLATLEEARAAHARE